MSQFTRLLPLLLPLAAFGVGEGALARSQTARPAMMPAGEAADAPMGFVEMCARDKALCLLGSAVMPSPLPAKIEFPAAMPGATGAVETSATAKPGVAAREATAAPPPGRITDEAQLRRLAKKINSEVNRYTVQVADTGEFWSRTRGDGERFGDCEDLAIEKRAELTEAGFPAERMFYAVSFVRGYGLHTVLIARLDDGDYILDSMGPRMKRWSDSKQVWLRRQVEGSPLKWVRLDGGSNARAGLLAQNAPQPAVTPS